MEFLTYICSACGRSKNIERKRKKITIKSKCSYCGLKVRFKLQDKQVKVTKIDNFCSSYTLAADLNILSDNVHVEGIKVKGNVNLNNSSGSSLREMKILQHKEKPMTGNINVKGSKVGSVNSNVISGDVNVTSSVVDSIDKNLIGFSFDNDDSVIEIINHMLGNDLPNNMETKLKDLQEILWKNPKIAEMLCRKLNKENNNKDGVLGSIILRNLKKLGIDTISKAKDKGIDALFKWFMVVIGIDL